tara:strand:+ start:1332 stop:2102 length:771 start_codon:yes stop_codon:yes gene_type:complete
MSYFTSCIYSGFVTHRRFKPKRHFFSYKTFSLLLNLSEIQNLEKKIKFFSYNKFNILSFYDIDHGARDGSNLTDWVRKILKGTKIDIGAGDIKLLCYPRFFGYVFNPLSIFYCYDQKSELRAILYEVKNTFNEQHTYVFKASPTSNLILHQCKKKFYVSPFIEMETFYNFRLLKPSKILNIFIKQTDESGTLLTASQIGKRLEFNSKNLFIQFLKHPLMSFKVILAIHFEAFRLWSKGIKHVKKKIKMKNNLSLEK